MAFSKCVRTARSPTFGCIAVFATDCGVDAAADAPFSFFTFRVDAALCSVLRSAIHSPFRPNRRGRLTLIQRDAVLFAIVCFSVKDRARILVPGDLKDAAPAFRAFSSSVLRLGSCPAVLAQGGQQFPSDCMASHISTRYRVAHHTSV